MANCVADQVYYTKNTGTCPRFFWQKQMSIDLNLAVHFSTIDFVQMKKGTEKSVVKKGNPKIILAALSKANEGGFKFQATKNYERELAAGHKRDHQPQP